MSDSTMSAIGPNIVGSVFQSGVAQAEHAKPGDAAKNAQADESRRAGAGADAILEVESTDGDTKVHTDSGGLGSQGRFDAKPEDETEEDVEDGVSVDESGTQHIDLSA